jgi:hypothetical protein
MSCRVDAVCAPARVPSERGAACRWAQPRARLEPAPWLNDKWALSVNNNLRLFTRPPASTVGLGTRVIRTAARKELVMTVVSTLDVHGLTAREYRGVMDELGVEAQPEPGIYLHLTTPIELGFRVVEIWDEKEGFDRFVEQRLAPAGEAVGLQREMTIAVTPLHNFFAPRLTELPALVPSLPGAPAAVPS